MIIAFYPGAGGNRYLQRLLGNDWTQLHRNYDIAIPGQKHAHQRYLLGNTPQPNTQHILTHCMNSKRIQQLFPGQPMVFINCELQASLQREWMLDGHRVFLDQIANTRVSSLEHYQAIRDPAWPDIDTEDQLDQLPDSIKQEVLNDYVNVINNTVHVPEVLAQLAQSTIDKINSAYEIITWHGNYYDQYPVDFSGADQVIDIDTGNDEFCLLMKTELSQYHSEIFNQVWDIINEQ